MNRTRSWLTAFLLLVALVTLGACSRERPPTALREAAMTAAPGAPAHDEDPPPEPDGEFTVDGQVYCRRGWLVAVGPCPTTPPPRVRVQVTYLPGTPLVADGSATGTAPLILPDSLIRNAATIGAPPLLGGAFWPDSLRFEVSVVVDGTSLEGRSVSLQVTSIDAAGQSLDSLFGHHHSGTGLIAKLAGRLSDTAVTTSPDGSATVSFRPTIVSGPVVLVATSPDAEPFVDTVLVGVPGLVPLMPSATFDTVGTTAIHPSANWVTPSMHALLLQLADTFYATYHKKLGYNDASLRYGGKFDLVQQWSSAATSCVFRPRGAPARPNPWGCHQRHRVGRDIDVRTAVLAARERDYIRRRWIAWTRLAPIPESDHWHFAYRR